MIRRLRRVAPRCGARPLLKVAIDFDLACVPEPAYLVLINAHNFGAFRSNAKEDLAQLEQHVGFIGKIIKVIPHGQRW